MPSSASISTPPLMEGDSLTSHEFLRRWEAMPEVKRAELIDGIVYMPSPVSIDHSKYQSFLNNWLGFYALSTPGCQPSLDGTWLMGERQTPQPDVVLQILPEYGGQSQSRGEYFAGAPELVVEVAVTSYSRDLGTKKHLYERSGVREYLVVVPREEKLISFSLASDGFLPLDPAADGISRSAFFPGLWLDGKALWELDLQRMHSVLQQGIATPPHADFAAQLAARKS